MNGIPTKSNAELASELSYNADVMDVLGANDFTGIMREAASRIEAISEAEPVAWPKRRASVPHMSGGRVVGFIIEPGDEAYGTYGLSEALAWLDRMCAAHTPPAGHVVVPAEVKDRIVQFLGWVAESYRAHAKDPDNHPEITDAYEGSAQMADELIAMLAALPLPQGGC